jgi:hypothetical protein
MIHAVFIALLLIPHTKVAQLPDKEIIRRSNFVVAATIDGFLCYGTKKPLWTSCHRAITAPEIEELKAYNEIGMNDEYLGGTYISKSILYWRERFRKHTVEFDEGNSDFREEIRF